MIVNNRVNTKYLGDHNSFCSRIDSFMKSNQNRLNFTYQIFNEVFISVTVQRYFHWRFVIPK